MRRVSGVFEDVAVGIFLTIKIVNVKQHRRPWRILDETKSSPLRALELSEDCQAQRVLRQRAQPSIDVVTADVVLIATHLKFVDGDHKHPAGGHQRDSVLKVIGSELTT